MKSSSDILSQSLMDGDGVVHTLYLISNTSSNLEKEQILKNQDSPLLRDILWDTYNDRKYYVQSYEVSGIGTHTLDSHYSEFRNLLNELASRNITGNLARAQVGDCLSNFDKSSQIILARILNKNLKIGAASTVASNLGITKKFPVRLAHSYADVADKIDIYDGTWLVSRKLDGCRLLVFISAHGDQIEVEFRSRQNKVIHTLQNLIPDYQELFKDAEGDFVVDGEICLMDELGNESFHGLMSEVTRKNHTIQNPKHIIYDFLTQDTFWGLEKGEPLASRLQNLKKLVGSQNFKHIQILDQVVLHSPQFLTELQTRARECGWEGLMIAQNVPYEGKRTNHLLKIKDFQDGEYIVQDIVLGNQTRSTESGSVKVNTTAALVIEHAGNLVKVGSGMSWEQRDFWKDHPEEIIGKTIGIRYFEETVDKKTGLKSLRFPTLYIVYGDSREL